MDAKGACNILCEKPGKIVHMASSFSDEEFNEEE